MSVSSDELLTAGFNMVREAVEGLCIISTAMPSTVNALPPCSFRAPARHADAALPRTQGILAHRFVNGARAAPVAISPA
jgi:hypothetical protein